MLTASDYWTMPTGELKDMARRLNHALSIALIYDSTGKLLDRQQTHYLGCKRCELEDIIRQRERIE